MEKSPGGEKAKYLVVIGQLKGFTRFFQISWQCNDDGDDDEDEFQNEKQQGREY